MALRKALLFLAGSALLLAVAGCGGSSGDDENDAATATAPASVTGNAAATTSGGTVTEQATVATSGTPDATTTPPPAGPEGAVREVRSAPSSASNDEEGDSDDPYASAAWIAPVSDWDRLGDPAGAPRGETLVHGGIDFDLTSHPNAPIYAACDGFVAGIDWSDTHGAFVVVKCPGLWTSVYAFLEDVLVGVNDPVTKGETVLASAGAFLHFETRYDFVPVDPLKVIDLNIRPRGVVIPTPTPTNTPVPTATPTLRPGETAPAGTTPSGPPPTSTPTPTPTATPTFTPIPSGNPTATPTKTPFPTATPKPSPSATPTVKPPAPTATPIPFIP